jgi:hypothetical protein
MIIFIDENMPPHLARGFDILQAPENIKLRVKIEVKYWDMLKLLVRHWPSISSIAIREDRPFAYKVSARGDLEVL